MKKTKLFVEVFLPKVSEWFHGIRPYRNSAGKREGLTISLKEFRKLGVPEKMLVIGAKFDLTIMVPDKDKMVLAPGGINKKGGYIGGATVDRLEELGYLPMPRIEMGDSQLGKDYVINVNSVTFYVGNIAVTVGETITEVGSEDEFGAEATANDLDLNPTDVLVTNDEVVTETVEVTTTETTTTETQGEQQSLVPTEESIEMVIALSVSEEDSLSSESAEVISNEMDYATMEALGIFGGKLENTEPAETETAETQGEQVIMNSIEEWSKTFFEEPAAIVVNRSENENKDK